MLVALFVANSIASIITINNNRQLSEHVATVIEPSLQRLDDFDHLLTASKMYTTNWVFLRANQEDKNALERLQKIDYPAIKKKLNLLSVKWDNRDMADSLQKIYSRFEDLLIVERKIMVLLNKFEDYDDPVAKLESEMLVEDELLPRTSTLTNALSVVIKYKQNIRAQKNADLEESFMRLRMLITALAITIILLGVFFSIYMARIIVNPINNIRRIVNDLGQGITRKVDHKMSNNEIGRMIVSVNNLSDKLQHTAVFANEIGGRNFDTHFEPLSPEDTLGKALVTMRDNLKAGDASLQEAQHIAKLGSWEWDILTRKTFWSDEMYNIFGIVPASCTPSFEKFREFIHPDDKEYADKFVAQCLLDHLPFSYEFRIVTLKNETKIVSGQGRISKNENGEPVKLTGIAQDITERKAAQNELENVNRELSILFNSIDEVFFSVNLSARKLIQVSPTCERLYGYNQTEFLADFNLWLSVIHPDDRHIIERSNEIMQRGELVNNEHRIVSRDNAVRWVEFNITPTLNENGKLIRCDGVIRDITQRKHDEEMLQKSQVKLAIKNNQLQQKNKELEQFAYVASHDLQEPLRTTISFVNIFKKQYYGRLDTTADKYLNYIVQASNRMGVLIKDLLDFSRIGINKDIEQVDCNLILREVIEDIDKSISDTNASIINGHLPTICGYSSELKQLFQNLIINAIKFRKPGSIPIINISAVKAGDCWNFAFADNGIGIDEAHNERIFIIFQRLHNRSEYEGSGIGLSHCKKIVELHHGKIWVASTPNKGSTFYFTLLIDKHPEPALKTLAGYTTG